MPTVRMLIAGGRTALVAVMLLGGTAAALPRSAATPPISQPGHIISQPASPDSVVDSDNWSGYAVKGAAGAFSMVSASWTEPTASCPATGSHYAYLWAGLDGDGDGTVEQLGTGVGCQDGTLSYFAWWEMYPAPFTPLADPVSPGDQITASVTAGATAGSYTLAMSDTTRGWQESLAATNVASLDASAEAILETPDSSLPDFGTASFASVQINGQPLASSSPDTWVITDSTGHLEDMVGGIGADQESFAVQYLMGDQRAAWASSQTNRAALTVPTPDARS